MVHLYQKKKIKTPKSFYLKESVGPWGVIRLHKYHIWYFGPQLANIRYWECTSKANHTMLDYSTRKKRMILQTSLKHHKILWKKRKVIWEKAPKNIRPGKITSTFLSEKITKKACWVFECFHQNLGIIAFTLENYSSLKVNFYLSVRVFLKYMIILGLEEIPVLMICLN